MDIHNQMEDIVTRRVNDIFDEEQKSENQAYCGCEQCRLDVSCYVLNRLVPRYVVSERGVAHTESGYLAKVQEKADIAALIHEGIGRVSSSKRPFFSHGAVDEPHPRQGAVFSFPMIKGRVINGVNFEPISEIEVALNVNSEPVEMVDPNWQNPCFIHPSGAGSFYFLPASKKADDVGERATFQFEVLIDDRRFEPLHHFFSISAISSRRHGYAVHTDQYHSCEDLYLFPSE